MKSTLRSPRRSSLRSGLTAFSLTFVLIAALAGPSLADSKSDLENQKNGIIGQLDGARKSYDQSSKAAAEAAHALQTSQTQLATAQATLNSVRGELVAAQAYDAQMQAQLVQSEADLAQAEAELAEGEKQVDVSAREVATFSVESIQSGDPGLRAFGDLLRGEDPASFTEQMSINNTVADAQLTKLDALDANRVLLDVNQQKVEALRDQVQAEREEAANNLVTITTLEQQATEQEAAVAELVSANTANKQAADAAVAADSADIAALEADRAATEARIRQLIAEEQANSGGGGGGGGGGGNNNGSSLSYPLDSVWITSPYGWRVHPISGMRRMHDGMDFGAGCGTPIRAAASGTVISQYYNGGYGNRVIVNHGTMRGANIVTTYNHLSRYAVSTGARVQRGQVIGYVGTTGSSTGCHLHFMVLVNGAHTNPAGWL